MGINRDARLSRECAEKMLDEYLRRNEPENPPIVRYRADQNVYENPDAPHPCLVEKSPEHYRQLGLIFEMGLRELQEAIFGAEAMA